MSEDEPQEIPVPPDGQVRRGGRWAGGTSRGEPVAGAGRCRHQPAGLSAGRVHRHRCPGRPRHGGRADADGCLVCPWHGSRYDVTDGRMVDGPQGFLLYRGPTPGYSGLVLAYGRHLRLRVARVARRARRILTD